jgi:hypothetical protein
MLSFITEAELKEVNEQGLGRSVPFVIQCVSNTQLSIARYYGGIQYCGYHYHYEELTDELIRKDVMRFLQKLRKKKPEKLISTNLEMF